jgi:hypothetical protein
MRGYTPRRKYRPFPFGWQNQNRSMEMAKKMSHSHLQPYPGDMGEPARILLDKLNGGDVDRNCCIHAAYQIQGVALASIFPDDDHDTVGARSVEGIGSTQVPSNEKAKEILTEATAMRGPLSDLFMKQLLAFVMAKLQEWLDT